MTPNPLFSVIITTHNRKEILPRAMRSVLEQSFGDFELLVVDNGSTDGTEKTVAGTKDERLIYARNPRPTTSCDGPRNLGIEMARGGLIAFLDDDDLWYRDRLKKVKEAFEANPDASAVCHYEYKVEGLRGQSSILRHGPWTGDIYEKLLYEGNCLSPCAMTINAQLLRRLGGFDLNSAFSGAADYDLWIRMAKLGVKVFIIEEPLGEFTLTGHNYSVKDAAYGAKIAYLVQRHIIGYERKPLACLSRKGMSRLFQLYAIAGRSYMRAGDWPKGLGYLAKASMFAARRPSIVFDVLRRLKTR